MYKKKTFIIVGGSQSHVPFVKAAKKLNFKVVIFDKNFLCPAKKICDEFYQISTLNQNDIVLKCIDIASKSNLAGIMTYSASPKALRAVAYACSKLKLPCFSNESLKITSNKDQMKKRFIKYGIETPDWILPKKSHQVFDFFKKYGKVIIKPHLNSRGSEGVKLCETKDCLITYLKKIRQKSKNLRLILENYCKGQEYSVDGIVIENKPIILSISRKKKLGIKHNFIMKGFSAEFPYIKNKKLAIVEKIAIKTVRSLGIANSFFSIDVIVEKSKVIILECGVLLDCKIDRMLSFVGIDVYSLFVKLASNMKINLPRFKNIPSVAMNFLFTNKEGRLCKKNNNKISSRAIVEWNFNNGDLVFPPKSISQTLGWVISIDKNKKKANERVKNIIKKKLFVLT